MFLSTYARENLELGGMPALVASIFLRFESLQCCLHQTCLFPYASEKISPPKSYNTLAFRRYNPFSKKPQPTYQLMGLCPGLFSRWPVDRFQMSYSIQ